MRFKSSGRSTGLRRGRSLSRRIARGHIRHPAGRVQQGRGGLVTAPTAPSVPAVVAPIVAGPMSFTEHRGELVIGNPGALMVPPAFRFSPFADVAAGNALRLGEGEAPQKSGGLVDLIRSGYEIYREEKVRREQEKRRKLGLPELTPEQIARAGAGVTVRADPDQMKQWLLYGGLAVGALVLVMALRK